MVLVYWFFLFRKFGDFYGGRGGDFVLGDVCNVQGGFWLEVGKGMFLVFGVGDKGCCGMFFRVQGGFYNRSLVQDVVVLCFGSFGWG